MSDYTPLFRRTFELEEPVSYTSILSAVEAVVTGNDLEQRIRVREGWADGVPLAYIEIHSPFSDHQLIIKPADTGVDFFDKEEPDYKRLAVEYRDWNDKGGEQHYPIGSKDETIIDTITRFADDVRDELPERP